MDELIEKQRKRERTTSPEAFNEIKTNNHWTSDTEKLVFLLIIMIPSSPSLSEEINFLFVSERFLLLHLLVAFFLCSSALAFKCFRDICCMEKSCSCHPDLLFKFVTKLNKLDQITSRHDKHQWTFLSYLKPRRFHTGICFDFCLVWV